MDLLNAIQNWGGLILSFLGIVCGIFAYIKHDRKLKEQETLLKEFQIRQFLKEEEKEKMADMKCRINRYDKGRVEICFLNAGKSDARNVRVEIPKEEDKSKLNLSTAKWGPYPVINSQSYREEIFLLYTKYPDAVDIQITWDDNYQNNRTVLLTVPL